MPKPKASIDLTPKPYRLLKTDLAAKLSPRSQGVITYLLLVDTGPEPQVHIAVTGNEGGGLWSKEVVSLQSVQTILGVYAGQPFTTKALRAAYAGLSSNNAPFGMAVLKDLGLVQSVPGKAHHYVQCGDWPQQIAQWMAEEGPVISYPQSSDVSDGQGDADGVDTPDALGETQADADSASASATTLSLPKGRKGKKSEVHTPSDEVADKVNDAPAA